MIELAILLRTFSTRQGKHAGKHGAEYKLNLAVGYQP